MKVYTKTGDGGTTSLIGGKRVSKTDARVEAYGTIDELDSFVGMLKNLPECPPDMKETLETIQGELFNINCLLASDDGAVSRNIAERYAIKPAAVTFLEQKIDEMSEKLPPISEFLKPGSNLANAMANVCRTVCRRAERRIYAIGGLDERRQAAAVYINRLSDYFFVAGRFLE